MGQTLKNTVKLLTDDVLYGFRLGDVHLYMYQQILQDDCVSWAFTDISVIYGQNIAATESPFRLLLTEYKSYFAYINCKQLQF